MGIGKSNPEDPKRLRQLLPERRFTREEKDKWLGALLQWGPKGYVK
jgi:hypothetical protein